MENLENQNQAEAYKQRIDKLVQGIDDQNLKSYFNDISSKAEEWKRIYGKGLTDYELFHILIWSTPEPDQQFIAFDLPGEDSIAAFIEELEKKYSK